MTSIATAEQMCMTAGPPTYLVPSHCSSDPHNECQRSFPTLPDTVQTAGAPRKTSHGNTDTGAALHLFHFIPHCINSAVHRTAVLVLGDVEWGCAGQGMLGMQDGDVTLGVEGCGVIVTC